MIITFLLASLGSGGAERVVSLLVNKMVESGHQVEIICLKFNDIYYQTDSRVKVTLAMQQTKNRLTELFWLRKYVKKQKLILTDEFPHKFLLFQNICCDNSRYARIICCYMDISHIIHRCLLLNM